MVKKKIVLIIILVILIIIAGFFAYQWWRAKKEIETKQKTSFVQCREMKAYPDDLVNIYLFGAIEIHPSRHVWDIAVIEPDGYGVGLKDIHLPAPLKETPTMEEQTPTDMDEDGTMDKIVATIHRKIGDYLIMVIPQQDISHSNTYSLRLGNLFLAENVPFSANLLDHLYIFRQTEDGIIPFVPASVGCRY